MSKLFIVLPCYNEEDNIGETIFQLDKQRDRLKRAGLEGIEVVAVNDGSRDNTAEELEDCKCIYDDVTVLTHKKSLGLGQAVKTGLEYVERAGGTSDLVCLMEADGSQDPSYIFNMLNKVFTKDYDCIIASRYQKDEDTERNSLFSDLFGMLAALYYSLILGIRDIKDYTSCYRLYKIGIIKRAFEVFGKDFIQESGFSCMVEILYKLHLLEGKFGEIPFRHRTEKKLVPKGSPTAYILASLRLALQLRNSKLPESGAEVNPLNQL